MFYNVLLIGGSFLGFFLISPAYRRHHNSSRLCNDFNIGRGKKIPQRTNDITVSFSLVEP